MTDLLLEQSASHMRRRQSALPTKQNRWVSRYYESIIMMVIAILGFKEIVPHGWLAVLMLFVVVFRLYRKIDHTLTILELTALIMILQCIIGPLLMYQSNYIHHKYAMYVQPSTYFQYVIPATAVFIAALFYPIKGMRRLHLRIFNGKNLEMLGFFLLGIGVLGSFDHFFPSMRFFFYLLSQFKYVGAICLIVSKYRFRWIILACVLLTSYLSSAENGMFGELFFWGCFITTFIIMDFQKSHLLKISAFLCGTLVLLTVQGIKAEYREAIDEGRDTSLISLANETLWSLGTVYEDENFRHVALTRLNQGWIISKAMQHVPQVEPFANGRTIKDAVYSSLVPRLLDKDKATAGGRAGFLRYTGLYISTSTTMCLGIIGEAYINYGVNGGILLMFLLGILFNRLFALFVGLGNRNSFFLLCIPLIFLQAVKPETDFVTVVNHLSKASLVVIVVYFALPKLLGSLQHRSRTKIVSSAINTRLSRREIRFRPQTP